MGITLFGSLQSTCTQRVILVLQELDVQYELSDVSMQKGEHKHPDYVKDYHPFGRIPVLDDDGTRLFESRAICRYLVAKYGEGSSLDVNSQNSPAEIGKFEQAASVEFSYFDPSMKTLAYEQIFKKFMGHGDADPKEVDRSKNLLTSTLDYYEKVTSTNTYLSGDIFTLVDIYHMPWVQFFFRLGLGDEISSRPGFEAWWKRVSDRPSWQTLLKSLPGH